MAKKNEGKTIRLTLVRSPIGFPQPQKATIKALGFRRLHQTVEHVDTPVLRGMMDKVVHLIKIEE
jgi:large subunit ribosomal protein L30